MNYLEIESCVINAKLGDPKEMEKIIEQFRPFIFKIAKTYNIKNYDLTDLSQIGFTALINSVHKYNPGTHTFSSYAYTSINNSLKYFARKNSKFNKDISINTRVFPESDSSIATEYLDCIEDTENFEEILIKTESMKELLSSISQLSNDEKELVHMLFYQKNTLKTYSDKKGMGYLRAVRSKNRILKKLRNCLNSEASQYLM
jgi:RNA polymerase sigma factor, sigma-70 family